MGSVSSFTLRWSENWSATVRWGTQKNVDFTKVPPMLMIMVSDSVLRLLPWPVTYAFEVLQKVQVQSEKSNARLDPILPLWLRRDGTRASRCKFCPINAAGHWVDSSADPVIPWIHLNIFNPAADLDLQSEHAAHFCRWVYAWHCLSCWRLTRETHKWHNTMPVQNSTLALRDTSMPSYPNAGTNGTGAGWWSSVDHSVGPRIDLGSSRPILCYEITKAPLVSIHLNRKPFLAYQQRLHYLWLWSNATAGGTNGCWKRGRWWRWVDPLSF